MKPRLVTPPIGPLVSLPDLKAHLRVDHSDDDGLIASLELAAVAHLDGWTGVLGRCIQPQTWEVDLAAGRHVLPFPDVESASIEVGEETVDLELSADASGFAVVLDAPATVTFSCAMPARLIPSVVVAVKMWVAEAYAHREGGAAGSGAAYQALVGALRWWPV
jgi:hypothetical protein